MGKYVLLSKNMDGSENEIYEDENNNICIEADSSSHARHLYADFQFEFSSRYEVKAVIFEQFILWYKRDVLNVLFSYSYLLMVGIFTPITTPVRNKSLRSGNIRSHLLASRVPIQ